MDKERPVVERSLQCSKGKICWGRRLKMKHEFGKRVQ